MKHSAWAVLCVLGLLGWCGCVPGSLGEFHLEEDVISPPPDMMGKWRPLIIMGDEVGEENIRPWIIGEDQMATSDGENREAHMEYILFRVGKHIFCDSFPGGPGSALEANSIWLAHVVPIHVLSKVEMEGKMLRFVPLNTDFVRKKIEEKELSFRYTEKEGYCLFNEPPERWKEMLTKYGNEKDAFSRERMFELTKM